MQTNKKFFAAAVSALLLLTLLLTSGIVFAAGESYSVSLVKGDNISSIVGDSTADAGLDYICVVTPAAGYHVNQLTVNVDGVGLPAAQYNFDEATGIVVVLGDAITGVLSINAAADARTPVRAITASFVDGVVVPKYGDTVRHSVALTSDEADIPRSMGRWLRKDGDTWAFVDDGTTFGEGTYRFRTQFRIDGDSSLPGTEYVLGPTCAVTVDGVAWTTITLFTRDSTFSYGWSESPEYVITRYDLSTATVTVDTPTLQYAGGEARATITVEDFLGNVLKDGVDFTTSYSSNSGVGTGSVTIQGVGDYFGSKSATFTIEPGTIASAVLDTTSYMYDGTAKTPGVTVTDEGGNALLEGTDYTVSYSDNVNAGTATVTVTGIGNYAFTRELPFTIVKKDEPTATNPTGTEPTATNPTGTEPTGTEPTGTNPTGTGTHAPTVVYGDANGDGAVNMKDVLAVRKHLAGLSTQLNLTAADANADGAVNMKDVLAIRKFIAGLIESLGA